VVLSKKKRSTIMKKIAYIIIIGVIITLIVLCIPDKTASNNITYTNICYDDGIVVSGYITPNE
jgi:hypothetical protein